MPKLDPNTIQRTPAGQRQASSIYSMRLHHAKDSFVHEPTMRSMVPRSRHRKTWSKFPVHLTRGCFSKWNPKGSLFGHAGLRSVYSDPGHWVDAEVSCSPCGLFHSRDLPRAVGDK